MRVTDVSGRTSRLAQPAKRIISLAPSVTEPTRLRAKDRPFITLDIRAGGTLGRYIDLVGGCGGTGPGPEGRTRVTGLGDVEYAMWRLSQ